MRNFYSIRVLPNGARQHICPQCGHRRTCQACHHKQFVYVICTACQSRSRQPEIFKLAERLSL